MSQLVLSTVSAQMARACTTPGPGSAATASPVTARMSMAIAALSRRCPRSSQNQPSACPNRSARAASRRSTAQRSAAYMLSCSAVSRRIQVCWPALRSMGSPVSASRRKYPANARRTWSSSPASARRSAQYARIVSSIRYRGSPPSATVRNDFSTRPKIPGRTASAASAPSWHTCSAAASVAPAGKTASRLASTCSGPDNSSQDQSTTARSVSCRGTVRLPPVSSSNLASSRCAS